MLAPVENLMGVATNARISTLVLIPVRKTRTPVVRPPSMKKRPFRLSLIHIYPVLPLGFIKGLLLVLKQVNH